MNDNVWIQSENFSAIFNFSLKVFFQKEGEQVCLNVIKNHENVGKFYCDELEFILATNNHKSVLLFDRYGRKIHAMAAPYQSLNVSVEKLDLMQIVL